MSPSFRIGAYSVKFYAADRGEPPHVHVWRGRLHATFSLESLTLVRNSRFDEREIAKIRLLLRPHRDELLGSWDEFFSE